MNILAIDPANRLGFAHSDGTRGVIDLQMRSDIHPGSRLLRFSRWLRAMLDAHRTDMIASEDASFGSNNQNTAAAHNELRGVLKLVAAERSMRVEFLNPTSVKSFATGNGNADKRQMIAACQTLLRITPRDDNEADALWILEIAKRPDCWTSSAPKSRRGKGKKSL